MHLVPLILACAPFVSADAMAAYVEQRSRSDPLAIRITETDRRILPQSKVEAVAAAKKLLAEGIEIEAGLAQIKSAEWARYGLSPETVFDPCKSLAAAERMLVAEYGKPEASPPRPSEGKGTIVETVRRLAPTYALDPDLVLALVETESDFNPRARSPKNARGLMQLIPETARRFGVRDPWNPEQNLHGGMAYLRWLLDRFDGDLKLALAGYNAGEKAVERYGGIPPYGETQRYVERIVARIGATGEKGTSKKEEGQGKAEQATQQASLFFEVVADGFSEGERLGF